MKLSEYKKLEENVEKEFGYRIAVMDCRTVLYEDDEEKTVKDFFIELQSNYEMRLYYELSDDLDYYEGSRRHSTIKLKGNSLKDLDKLIKDLELVRDVSDYVIEKCPFPIRI